MPSPSYSSSSFVPIKVSRCRGPGTSADLFPRTNQSHTFPPLPMGLESCFPGDDGLTVEGRVASGPTGRPWPAPEAGKRIRSRASTSFAGWLRSAPVLRWRPVDECLVCGSPNVVAGGRCGTCDRFLKRTGRDRSTDEIERPLYHAITRIRGGVAGLT